MIRLGSLAFLALGIVLASPLAAPAGPIPPEVTAEPGSVPRIAEVVSIAERMRRLHLAMVGLDAADGHARLMIDRATVLEDAAAVDRDERAARVRQARQDVAGGVAAVMAALRIEADPRARAARRAAFSARRFGWTATEREWRGAQASATRLAAERLRGELLLRDLDERALQVARLRDTVDDAPLAVVAMAARGRPMAHEAFAMDLGGDMAGGTLAGPDVPRLTSAALLTSGGMAPGAAPVPAAGEGLRWPALGQAAGEGGIDARAGSLEGRLTAWSGLLASVPATTAGSIDLDRMTDRGLVLQAPAGGAIVAPDAGTVVFAGSFRSYGQILIIDHGNDYHTLMAGFSHLDVAEGALVHAGERIGELDSGSSVPGRLYVEVRRRGVPVDPMPWLAAREDKVRG